MNKYEKRDWGYIFADGKDMAIDTEHGLIFVSEQEFNDVRDRYFVEQKTTDDGCYILKFDVDEDFTDTVKLGRAIRWKKIKEPTDLKSMALKMCIDEAYLLRDYSESEILRLPLLHQKACEIGNMYKAKG